MDNIMKTMLEHPIASIVIISVTLDGIAKIIGVAKGANIKPMIDVSLASKNTK